MNNEILTNIKKECEELANKRSWVRKGFDNLMNTINKELGESISIEKKDIYNSLDIFVDNPDYEGKVFCIEDGKIMVSDFCYGYDNWESSYTYLDMDNLEIEEIKILVNELPDFLESILKKVKNQNQEITKLEEKIKNILSKF